jgi:hypothetical protein
MPTPGLWTDAMPDAPETLSTAGELPPQYELTAVVVPLLKGVLYRDEDPGLWAALLKLQPRLRDYMAVLALDVRVDEAEGYAFLRSFPDADDAASKMPRLVRRQPLGFVRRLKTTGAQQHLGTDASD